MTQQMPSLRTVACLFFSSSRPSAFCRHIARSPKFLDRLRRAVLPALAAILLVLGMAVPSLATTWTVTSTGDSGTGTLRAALGSAANGDTINFSLTYPATITLTSGPLTIGTSLAISGPGAANLFISGNNATTVFLVNGVTATISGITIENGANLSGGGGGITNLGTLTVSNSTFLGDSSQSAPGGGGIQNQGTLTVSNSTFSGNSAPTGNGGGIENFGSATVINSTFSGNSSDGPGGGIATYGTLAVSNSTFSGNSVGPTLLGGAIGNDGTLTLKNTLMAGQKSGGNCYLYAGTTTSDGYNLSDDSSCSFLTATGDQTGVTGAATYLGPLKNNGGPTSTFALLSGSTAIDAIPYGSCTDANGNAVLTDQRGIVRAGNCDIGAYEVQAIANVCPGSQTTPAPCSYTMKVTMNLGVFDSPVNPVVVTQGASGLDFNLAVSGCQGGVGDPTICTTYVNFVPLVPGLRQGAVLLHGESGNLLASADIYGIGEAPAVAFPGAAETTFASLSTASYLAVDAAGDVFVTNNSLPGVTEIPAGCTSSSCYQTLAAWLDFNSEGVAVDGAGNLYVSVFSPKQVYKIPAGCTSSSCQTAVDASFGTPLGLTVDGAGNLYVADNFNGHPLWEVPVAGPQFTVGTGLNGPEDAVVDSANNVFVGDSALSYLVEIPPTGGSQTNIGSFTCPDAVAVDAAGDLFATDGCGEATEFPAGCTVNSCAIPVANDLSGPVDVKVDSLGNIFIADQYHSRVQEVSRSQPPTLAFGSVTEFAESSTQTVTLQNIGNKALTFTSIGITLDNTDFKLALGTTNECSLTSPLAPGGTCNVGVECAPENTGSLSGTLTLADNALNATSGAQAIPLSCMGQSPALNTSTSISSSQNPSYTNGGANSVTFTATVTSSQVVNEGTVAFTANGNDISGCTAVVVSNGVARCTTSFTTEGTYSIEAAYSGYTGATSFGPSSGTLSQTVANKTEVSDNGNMFCNPAGPATPSTQGAATPYPSEIFVSNFTGNIVNMTVELYGISSSNLPLTDLLLVGPTGATIVPFGGIGDNSTISEVNVTLSDSASSLLPSGTALASGTYKPTSLTSDLSFPAPAPSTFGYAAPTGSTTLSSQFAGTSPNGTWQLFAIADGTDGVATISGGWCVTFPATPSVSVAGATTSYGSTAGVATSATFTGSGGVAPSGTVSFSAATGSFSAASCTSSGAVLSCSSTYTPSGTLAANTYTGYITASITAAGGYTSASGTGTLTVTQQTPTVAVTNVSVNSEAYGSGTATTVTATLSWTGNGVAPTGGLSFSSTAAGGFGPANCIGTTSPISCSATFTPTATDAPNTYTLSANFSGDTNYATASSTQTNNFSIAKNSSVSLSITNVSTTYGSTTPVSVSTLLSWSGGGSAPTAAHVSIGFVGSGTSIGGSVGSTTCGAPSGDSMTCSAMYTPSGSLGGGAYTSPTYNTLKAGFSGDANYTNAASAADTVTVDQAPAITSASGTTFTVGVGGTFTVTTTGYPAPSISESGGLPGGVTFVDNGNGTGTLAGTPTSGGLFSITFTASNNVGSNAVQSFTLTVNQAPVFTSANSAVFTIGVAGSFTVTTAGYPTPSITESGHLPTGLTFVDNGNGTGTLKGTPMVFVGGDFPISFTAKNGIGSAVTQAFTIILQQAPSFTSANNAVFVYGVPNSFTVTTSAFPTASIHEAGTLPPWLTFVDNGNGTGTLSGTPSYTSGTFALVLSATNVVATAQQNFTLSVSGINLSPSNLVFGTLYLNSSTTLPVTVTNVGSTTVTVSGVSITPGTANAAAYAAVSHCTTPLKSGKNCIIDVTFKADAEGTLTATLNLMDNAVGMPQHVGLTGNVIDPVAEFNPTKLAFGTQAVHSSTTLPVQLTNSGQTPLDISNISIGGADAGDFSQTNSCPAILAAAASCTISVTFDPAAKGARTGTLIVTDNVAAGQSTVTLTGTGH